MQEALSWTNFYRHPRFWRHIGLWIFAGMFFFTAVYLLGDESDDPGKPTHKLIFFLCELWTAIYASFYAYNILAPKKKYKAFFGSLVLIIIAVSAIDQLLQTTAISIGGLNAFWANIVTLPIILFSAFGLKLSYHGARQVLAIERLEAKQTESELKLLKSQVNPHFLFNTLNNIYSTNLDDHKKANEIILELADLLRYQLESNKQDVVLLSKEIVSLENYVSIEKIRVRDCEVRLSKYGNYDDVEIVPLLLLPFVENAFKYGTGIEKGAIDIRFDIDDKRRFTFQCVNKVVEKNGKVQSGGIGLENVKKRLALKYSGKHDLSITDEKDYFTVDLKIQL